MNKGFTLIELLVVVLIIGILAAIALPQYTKAVERSRMSEAVQMLGDLATAESVYFMQNGEFVSVANSTADASMPGDVTIVVPKYEDGDTWAFTVSANDEDTTNKAPATLTAERKGGMYNGNKLQITVSKTGAINKCYISSNTDFQNMAKTAGYNGAC